jgi:hypothetical protein
MKPAARSARPVAAMLVNIGDESRSPMVLGPPSPLGSPAPPRPTPPPPEDEPEEEEDPDPLDASLAASWAALPAPAASGSPGLEGLAGLPPLGWKFSHPELGFFGASAQKARLMASNSLRTASAALEREAALLTRSPRREAASAARAAAPRAHPRATRGGRRDRPEVRGEPSVGGSRGRDGRVASGIGQSPLRGDGEHVGDGTRRSSGRRHDSVRR